jgi:hypothetical protein
MIRNLLTASAATKVSVAALVVLGSAGAAYGAVQAVAPGVPAPAITSAPARATSALTATFAFTDSLRGVTFECSRDGSAFAKCTSPKVYSGLTEGGHIFAVRAKTAAGTSSPATTYSWQIDRTPPAAPTLTGRPADPTNATTAALTFTGPEAGLRFECNLDGNGFAACASPKTYTRLGEFTHTFKVRAIDAAGNTGPATTYKWGVDLTPPAAPVIVTRPASPTTDTSATLTFRGGGAGATYQCRLDGSGFAACTTPRTYTGLASGAHSFSVRALDPAGNTSAAVSANWTVTVPITKFGLSGNVPTSLYPGASVPMNVSISNPFSFPIKVTSISVQPKAATTKNGQPNPSCDGTVNLTLTHQFTGSPVTIAAGATRSLSQLGVVSTNWPLLTMPNLPVNQDACKATSFAFDYTGTATEVTP